MLAWLRERLIAAGYTISEPATEDWGWYVGVEKDGASYLVGASADAENPATDVDWVIQVHKSRTEVRVFTRQLQDVTDRVPEIVESVQNLPVRDLVLEGEAIALRPDGRPRPFQVTMRRLGRSNAKRRDDRGQ